jgi:hypothetical protein
MKFIAHIFILIYSLFINASHSDDDREVMRYLLFFSLSEEEEHTQKRLKILCTILI